MPLDVESVVRERYGAAAARKYDPQSKEISSDSGLNTLDSRLLPRF